MRNHRQTTLACKGVGVIFFTPCPRPGPDEEQTARFEEEPLMPQRTVVIASPSGLHARPAALFVKAAAASGVGVRIAKSGGDPVDAASMLDVLTLNAAQGDEVVLSAEGEGADEALDSLADLLRHGDG